jgi:hypothetical protein
VKKEDPEATETTKPEPSHRRRPSGKNASPAAANPAFDLHRKAGNRAMSPVLAASATRSSGESTESAHSFQVQVRWSDDSVEFYHRLVSAVSRQSGVPEAALWQPLNGPSNRLHNRLAKDSSLHYGAIVRVSGRVSYDPTATVASVDDLQSEIKAAPRTESAVRSDPSATDLPPTGSSSQAPSQSPETTEQRLRRQATRLMRTFGELVAEADAEGYSGVDLKIEHTGQELVPGFEKKGPQVQRPGGTVPVSADTIAREEIKPLLEMILISRKGVYEIRFARNEQGRMSFLRGGRVEKPRQISEREELEALGVPDRRKIYAEIFQQTQAELKDAGIMIAGFTLEQLVLWIVGGMFFRALGLLGEAAAEAFPFLRRALLLRRTANIAEGIAALGEKDAGELAAIMEKLSKGIKLTSEELARLKELLPRLEAELARIVPSLRVIGRIGDSGTLVREAGRLSDAAQREVNSLLEQYLAGNPSPGIGTKHLDGGIFYLRGRQGGRIFLRERPDGYLEILGKADKGNESTVIAAVLKEFL